MCVIAIYQGGARPSLSDIEKMMKANSDGAGVAYNDGRRVYFRKGFTTAEAVKCFIDRIPETARDVVFHARIGTSGGISAQKCHPYIISGKNKELNKTIYKGATPCVFHNGVLSITPESGLNDTQTFIKNVISPLYSARLDLQAVKTLFNMAIKGSKIAILTPEAVIKYGDGWQLKNGVFYSNLNWEWSREDMLGVYGYGGRDWRYWSGTPERKKTGVLSWEDYYD